SSPQASAASSNGEFALHFGSNGGGWRGRIRSTLNNFAADHYVSTDSSIRYGGWSPIWNSSNELDTYLITDNNADGRLDLAKISSSDAFSALTTVITSSQWSVCRSLNGGSAGTPFLVTKYDSLGRLNILFSVKKEDSNTCEMRLIRSDNFTKYWNLKADDLTSLEPKELYFKSN